MPDGDLRLYPLFDALSGDMLLRPFYPNTPTPHYITLDQIAGFVGQGSIGPEGPEGPPGPEGPMAPAGPPGTGEGASGLSGMVAGQIPIAATATTVTSSAALSGDVTSNATLVTTLATVNSNVGTFQGLTVNAKGLVTAAMNQSYLTSSALTAYAPLASPRPDWHADCSDSWRGNQHHPACDDRVRRRRASHPLVPQPSQAIRKPRPRPPATATPRSPRRPSSKRKIT